MKTIGLYNGKMLPEFVFNARIDNCLFYELNLIFDDEFIIPFREFLVSKNILSITVKNLVPELFTFEEEVLLKNFESSFKDATCNETKQDYIDAPVSLYMMVEQGLIFSKQDEEFCIFLDRELWIAIIALKNVADKKYFNELTSINFIEYFNQTLGDLPGYADFGGRLKSNWI